MQLTKTQVLALFLSAAAAQTDEEFINGPYNRLDANSKTKIPPNTLKECNGNSDCVPEGGCPKRGEAGYKVYCVEKCASFQVGDTVADMKDKVAKNYCVSDKNCGALGKKGGVAWSLQCWADAANNESASVPAKVENKANLDALDNALQPRPDGDKYSSGKPVWATTDNLWVSPRYNYQEGWYHTADPTKEASWTETDKALWNTCGGDDQCAPKEPAGTLCCMNWPDQNNLHCKPKDKANTEVFVGQMKFTPQCESGWSNVPQDVGNASDAIAENDLAEAQEALEGFFKAQLADAKKNAGYDDLTAEKKIEFDTAQEEIVKNRNVLIAEFKKLAKVNSDDCKLDCQADYEKNLNDWFKEVYETCSTNANSIECREANELRKKEEAARAAGDKNFYTQMKAEDKAAYKKTRDEENKKEAASLAAAWIKANVPKDGEVGSACNAETIPAKCSAATHCCGTATPKDGAFVKESQTICNVRTAVTFNDQLGEPFTFKCQEMAKHIAASVATIGAFTYSLM